MVRSLLAYFVRLRTQIQRLHVLWLGLEDLLEAMQGLLLLVHTNVAARAEQVAVLHCLVDGRQIALEIGRGRLHCIKRVESLG